MLANVQSLYVRCDYRWKTCLLLELAAVLLLVYRSATVGQDSIQHVNSNDESVQSHGNLPRKTVSILSSQYHIKYRLLLLVS